MASIRLFKGLVMVDFMIDKKIGIHFSSDLKCSSHVEVEKVVSANIYPTPGDNVYYWNEFLYMYCIGVVEEYKTPSTLIIKDNKDNKDFIFTLKKNGEWTLKRSLGDNIFDSKFMKYLKVI